MIPIFSPASDAVQHVVVSIRNYLDSTLSSPEHKELKDRENLSAEEVSNILNVTFWAGQVREEGRQCKPCVYLGEPKLGNVEWRFTVPRPFNPKEIAKLASGTDPNHCWISIRRDDSGKLVIWGLSPIPATFGIAVETIEPGSLLVKNAIQGIAILKPNEFPILLSENQSHASQVVAQHFLQERFSGALDWRKIDLLLRITKAIAMRGLGGTILLVDSANGEWHPAVQHQYEFAATPALSALIQEFDDATDTFSRDKSHHDSLSAFLDWELPGIAAQYTERSLSRINKVLRVIARISSLDGAIVMNERLALLEVGAKIHNTAAVESVDLYEFGGEKHARRIEVPLEELGGTRHQSAARFAAACKSCVAFVISQDGRLTFLYSNNEGVHA
ncbi:MAG: putative sensor domain DACNV-containing protein, partial [Usitatibacteraceae bacterium]